MLWYEIWGTEHGAAEKSLLHKIPGDATVAQDVVWHLQEQGVTDIEVITREQ